MRFHVRTRVHREGGRGGGVEWRARVSSSSYFQRAIIKGKAERERCARVKGKGINYCRVPGEICKLNSARARERGEGGCFPFFHPFPPPLDAARFDHAALLITRPIDSPVFFRPVSNFREETKELRHAACCGQFEWCSFFFFFFAIAGMGNKFLILER